MLPEQIDGEREKSLNFFKIKVRARDSRDRSVISEPRVVGADDVIILFDKRIEYRHSTGHCQLVILQREFWYIF